MKDVTSFYPSRPENIVLKGIKFKFPAGKTTAIVGASGSGKSSIVDLIERFYDPIEGEVLLDGNDVKYLNIKWLRQQISVVSQHPGLFATTVYENICRGLTGTLHELASAEIQDALIKSATKAANAHDFIEMLPNGYDTLVGEKGSTLSGGQEQYVLHFPKQLFTMICTVKL